MPAVMRKADSGGADGELLLDYVLLEYLGHQQLDLNWLAGLRQVEADSLIEGLAQLIQVPPGREAPRQFRDLCPEILTVLNMDAHGQMLRLLHLCAPPHLS